MEAFVGSDTGLLPEHLEMVRLTNLAGGRWQAVCEDDAGHLRSMHFDSEGAQANMTTLLRRDFGFTDYSAGETARRLFEPFEEVADWPW